MRYYLLHIWGDVEPYVLGPYKTAEHRDTKAKQLRREDPEGHNGIFMLNIPEKGRPAAQAYRSGFLQGCGDE